MWVIDNYGSINRYFAKTCYLIIIGIKQSRDHVTYESLYHLTYQAPPHERQLKFTVFAIFHSIPTVHCIPTDESADCSVIYKSRSVQACWRFISIFNLNSLNSLPFFSFNSNYQFFCDASWSKKCFTYFYKLNFFFTIPKSPVRFLIKTIFLTLFFAIHALKNYQTILIFIIFGFGLFIVFIKKKSNLFLNFILFYLLYFFKEYQL